MIATHRWPRVVRGDHWPRRVVDCCRCSCSSEDVRPCAKTDDLVPLSIGLAYEENPTISYIPVQGEATLRRMVMPITIDEGYVLLRAASERDVATRELFRRVNGLENPVGGPSPPEFERFIDLYLQLSRAGVLSFGRAAGLEGAEPPYFTSLHDYGAEHADEVRDFLEVLGIEDTAVAGETIRLPFHLADGQRATDAINVETTSALDWIRHAGHLIEVPAAHLESGIVEPHERTHSARDQFITIRSSERRPADALVAIPFRGWWYYVDATDARSKNSFKLIKFLIRLRLDLDSAQQQVPVLTVPVG